MITILYPQLTNRFVLPLLYRLSASAIGTTVSALAAAGAMMLL